MRVAHNIAVENRHEPRVDVHHRARVVGPGSRIAHLLVVNVSANGVMLRSEDDYAMDDRLTIELPVVGRVEAEVRWMLGGRMGCQLDRAIGTSDYYLMLSRLV